MRGSGELRRGSLKRTTFLWGVLKLTVGWLYSSEYIKNDGMIHLKWVNRMTCEFSLHNAVKEKETERQRKRRRKEGGREGERGGGRLGREGAKKRT